MESHLLVFIVLISATATIYASFLIPCQTENAFTCDEASKECISAEQKCNGISECSNGFDESVKTCGCLPHEFQCNETNCVDLVKRCDTVQDCDAGEDEINCESYVCPVHRTKCKNYLCVPSTAMCNFIDDCGDNSDEENCKYRSCYLAEFRCNNSECIPESLLCDGIQDCVDGSDETECESHFQCSNGLYIHKDKVCDFHRDCLIDHDDETNCGKCPERKYQCQSGECIDISNQCDGICDCAHTCDDENKCGSMWCQAGEQFMCPKNYRCIKKEFLCDGFNDCKNTWRGTDESFCVNSSNSCNIFKSNFMCQEGRCLPSLLQCNTFIDCLNGEDESNCTLQLCTKNEFRCSDNRCIDKKYRCDGKGNCYDRSDEHGCETYDCPPGHRKCRGGQCIAENKWCDFWRDCPDNSDEEDCELRPCKRDEFKCDNGQCIPGYLRCFKGPNTDRLGCADYSHLKQCQNTKCESDQFKCRNAYCITQKQVCNGKTDCLMSKWDEFHCAYKCPYPTDECVCFDISMNCTNRGLFHVPNNNEGSIQFHLAGNFLNYTLSADTFKIYDLTTLDISNNSLSTIPPDCFAGLWRLQSLNLADNQLTEIENDTFVGLSGLRSLNIERNNIQTILPNAFRGLSSLSTLDLSKQRLTFIEKNVFNGLRKLRFLNLSGNQITNIEDGAFNGLKNLLTLDISNNMLITIGENVFHGLTNLHTLYTDEYRFCCLAKGVPDCNPKPDEFSSCEDLMSNYVLRASIWILGITASFGNVIVIIWRTRDKRSGKVHSFLITNLALGDMFMGVYLMIIAVADTYYRGSYILYDKLWRSSILCHFAGFIATFSSELSVFTLTVITLDRLICILFPFRSHRMGLKEAQLAMLALWIFVFFLSAVPLFGIEYFKDFYSRSGVCLALHITPDRPRGWEYSVMIFLAVNLLSFLIIFISYLWMFIVAKKTRSAVRTAETKTDSAMAKRITLIVLTDFFCWIPIIILGIASLCGQRIPPEVYAWVAVFILPVNSAINPVLYTLSTAPFLGNVRKRATKFRKSFMTSLTFDTKHSYVDRTSGNYWERTNSNYRQFEIMRMRPMTKCSSSQTPANNGIKVEEYIPKDMKLEKLKSEQDSAHSQVEVTQTEDFV
ncbi:G-protein coupled receptor GRL101 isoform X2 [Octopus sinensis]|uniref:G-protein coupled receptor GRL101 isoform X2 n=1 Tax=Octopus sinensis TaxID=2607531 RepID=A0A6P7S600_9MOLL|nr:G-protein coupled receptor GRL101 isoform X2 [Octopus sinensis]